MSEYIKREDAKLRIFEYGLNHRDNISISSTCENLERQMNAVPSADVVERKTGEWGYRWKVHGDGRRPTELFPCSECGYESTMVTNFCPNCGADMREENENDIQNKETV